MKNNSPEGRDTVAKETVTVDELVRAEDRLREIAANIGKIRKCVVDEKESEVELSVSTFRFYLDWIEAWADKNVSLAKTAMKAVNKHKSSASQRKKS